MSKLEDIKRRQENKATGNTNLGYIVYNGETKDGALKDYGKTVAQFDGIVKSQSVQETAVANSADMRSPWYPGTYEQARPYDTIPYRFKDIIISCRSAYIRIGVVRNVIDLMTDFAGQGLKIIHNDDKVEAFLNTWRKKINLDETISEFCRHILIDGNIVIKRKTATLSKPVQNQWDDQTEADTLKVEKSPLKKREIPWQYTFINVAALEWMDGLPSDSYKDRKLGFISATRGKTPISRSGDPFNQNTLINIDNTKKNTNGLVELDMSQIYVCHNKKDSWEDWAPPFIYSVLTDIQLKNKLKQAEFAALDGVINVIRLWRLGDHKEQILPDSGAISRLLEILKNNTGGGTMDIVWDSMIDMKDFYPPIDKILGQDKFLQVDKDILIGLGVPEVLLGGSGANFSNSFIQLKTIIEKLNYIRGKVLQWLSEEMRYLCDSMGFDGLPTLKFSASNLDDENTTRKLIVGLLDRGIISSEAVLESYGENFGIEIDRIRKEKKIYKGLDVTIKSPYDKTDKNGVDGQGRPISTPDSSKRSTRTPKVRTTGDLNTEIFAMDAMDAIDEWIIPLCMENMGVSNARKLNSEQREELDKIRILSLSCINTKTDISQSGIIDILQNCKFNAKLIESMNNSIEDYVSENGKMPNINQKKRLMSLAWSNFNTNG